MQESKKENLYTEEVNYINKKKIKRKKKSFCNCYDNVLILLIILLFVCFCYIIKIKYQQKIVYIENAENYQPLETFDLNVLESIQNKIKGISELTQNEQKFLNGVLRKFKPKKVVEIGVSRGGTSTLILNAIKDIKGAKLYSIDKEKKFYRNPMKNTGFFVGKYFPDFMNNWELNVGGITSEFIEKIGGDIDLVMLDTVHLTPGEMLDWLQVLPFLKEEAIVVLHDTFFMYYDEKVIKNKLNCPNNQLLTFIRGELILPSYGNSVFFRNIGALKLDKDQKKYYKQYFLALGTQWEYMPEEKYLKIMREFFMKYYGEKCVEIFDDAVTKNKIHLNLY